MESPWGRQQAHQLQKESSGFAVLWTGSRTEKAALDLQRQNRVIPRSREGKETDSRPVASWPVHLLFLLLQESDSAVCAESYTSNKAKHDRHNNPPV